MDRGDSLVDRIDAALPQTQCRRCGYDDCRAYAHAVADGDAALNRCPPGGAEGIARLARITGRPALPLDPACGREGPRHVAVIDEAWCIGCTLCLDACPVDCIVGASKLMHSVVASQCTGCDLCLPACPVDCIRSLPVTGERSGWDAWSAEQARVSLGRYQRGRVRRTADATAGEVEDAVRAKDAAERHRSLVAAAVSRARVARRD